MLILLISMVAAGIVATVLWALFLFMSTQGSFQAAVANWCGSAWSKQHRTDSSRVMNEDKRHPLSER